MGEKLDDFEQFHPERMASRILGMGDMLTLIEKAEGVVDKKDAAKITKKLQNNTFDMNDLLEQLKQIQKMGPLKQVIAMLPGVGDKVKDMDVDERQFIRIQAIITSKQLGRTKLTKRQKKRIAGMNLDNPPVQAKE